jgi:glyoxylase-like metal-dependent hydrolase (beta-lactamase superfamily II)
MSACASVSLGAAAQAPPAEPVAAGVYAWIGSSEEAAPENGGVVGNSGFIVGSSGVILVGTGSSYAHGQRLIAEAERLGGKPVVLGIVTQPLQEFVMGAAAFAERGIPLLAHERTAALVTARCETCLKNLKRLLGEEAMRSTRVLAPGQTIAASQLLEVGGRRLRLWHAGWGSSPGDLAVIDEASGVAFTGALLSVRRIPELRDARLPGWRAALLELKAMPLQRLVPGYGPPGTRADIDALLGYFDALEQQSAAALDRGLSLLDAAERSELPAYRDWALYARGHSRNVQQTYLRLEALGLGNGR